MAVQSLFHFSQMKVQRRNVKTKKVGVKPPSPTATQMWQKKNVKNIVVLVKVRLSHKNNVCLNNQQNLDVKCKFLIILSTLFQVLKLRLDYLF